MAKLDFYYATKKVNEDIVNWRDLEIEVSFEDEDGIGSVKTVDNLEFTGELATNVNRWNDLGMYGGPGIFEAPPFSINVCGGKPIFDGGINTADCSTLYECDKVSASLRSQKIDLINDRANSFTFAYLASPALQAGTPGKITQADYVRVPYVINSIPDYVNIMVSGLSLFTLIRELKNIVTQLTNAIKKLIGDVSTALGMLPLFNAALAVAIGQVLVDIAAIILLVIYVVFIIKAIIELVLMIFDNLIQPVKYKKSMRVRTLFEKASAYLGYTFSSTLLTQTVHKDEVIIPRKTALLTNAKINLTTVFGFQQSNKNFDDNFNPASVGYFEGTFADLILLYEDRFNAELRIIGNTLHFETKEHFAKFANYTLPNIKRNNADPHGTNACELTANYLIIHALDDQDTNTYDEYEGTSAQMTLEPITVLNKKNILLKGITEKRLNLALAKRKKSLNGVEKLFSDIYTVLYQMLGGSNGLFGSIMKIVKKQLAAISQLTGGSAPSLTMLTFPSNPFQARVGMMLLSSDFIGVQKVVIINAHGQLNSNNATLTSARYLMDNYHFTNFAIRTTDSYGNAKNDHNQWLSYTDKEVPFCCEDYNSVLDNNFIKTYDQKTAKVKSFVWNPYREMAKATYRVKQQYTRNLRNTYVIDGK